MKKLLLIAGSMSLLGIACRKEIRNESLPTRNEMKTEQKPLRCGRDEAMANMSPAMRQALARNAETNVAQSTELLLFLDFNGAVVRAGFPNPTGLLSPIITGQRFCPPVNLSQEQIDEIVELVKDDFSPFNIRVTTDQSVFDSYTPAQNKQISIITTIPQVIGMGSGIAGVSPWSGPGLRMAFNPTFTFASVYGTSLADIAMTISHESGHALGLDHQRLYSESCNPLLEYHPGFGEGPTSFAPIMGDGFKRITNWFAQACPLPMFGVTQNDFEEINTHVALREDDFPNTAIGSEVSSDGEISGVLEQAGDVDYILVNFKNRGDVKVSSENIDLKVSVYTPGGQLLSEDTDPDDTGVTIAKVAGKRYLKIEAISNPNMAAQFMTGTYKISY